MRFLFKRKRRDQYADELPLVLGIGDVIFLDGVFWRIAEDQVQELPKVKTQPPESW